MFTASVGFEELVSRLGSVGILAKLFDLGTDVTILATVGRITRE